MRSKRHTILHFSACLIIREIHINNNEERRKSRAPRTERVILWSVHYPYIHSTKDKTTHLNCQPQWKRYVNFSQQDHQQAERWQKRKQQETPKQQWYSIVGLLLSWRWQQHRYQKFNRFNGCRNLKCRPITKMRNWSRKNSVIGVSSSIELDWILIVWF